MGTLYIGQIEGQDVSRFSVEELMEKAVLYHDTVLEQEDKINMLSSAIEDKDEEIRNLETEIEELKAMLASYTE